MTVIASRLHAERMTETAIVELVPRKKSKGGRPRGAKRSAKKLTQNELAAVVLDYTRGTSQHEIASKFGVSESAVSLILEKFKPAFAELGNVEEYRKAKADLLDSTSLAVLKEISNPSKIIESDIRALSFSYDVLNKHSRLERNLSTSNVATQSVAITLSASNYTEE